MKFIVAIITLTVSLSSVVGFGVEYNGNNNSEVSQSAGDVSIVKGTHDCPQQNGASHEESGPCSGFCHHSGHCHYLFPDSENIVIHTSNYSVGSGYSRLYSDPHPDGLFRPPII